MKTPTHCSLVMPGELRSRFSAAMSEMYKKEVPLYGKLLEIVRTINQEVLAQNPSLEREVGCLDRVSQERHGAIRLGSGRELRTIAQVSGTMAMKPVGYYDLSVAGLPVHSTAFRPVDKDELALNPFRVFTSVLRTDLLEQDIQREAEEILEKREIFSAELKELLLLHRSTGGFDGEQAERFITESLKIFQWHTSAMVPLATYERMLSVNSLLADIVCFRGPHINHLTPRVLDIYRVHRTMAEMGIVVIPEVQGPPEDCRILLKQTSFKALNEEIQFPEPQGGFILAKHRARFGEIELRDTAIKPRGRAIYDRLTSEVSEKAKTLKKQNTEEDYFEKYTGVLNEVFRSGFPAWTGTELLKSGLGYFQYHLMPENERPHTAPPALNPNLTLEEQARELVKSGWLRAVPITYEDFLPVSAAGIFKSNLDEKSGTIDTESPNQAKFEEELGSAVLDPFALYQDEEDESIRHALAALEFPASTL
jgi:uncharacterized glyoxalase superfamily metalloenzyme YdcJ